MFAKDSSGILETIWYFIDWKLILVVCQAARANGMERIFQQFEVELTDCVHVYLNNYGR